MKKLLAILIAILSFSTTPVSAASDPNLYFENAVFDYYLEKTDTGTTMKVKETLRAVFSEKSTSHGIVRTIPFTNQNGRNITLENLDLKVTRNGVSEPIAKTEKEDGYYKVNIGTKSKTVQGEQIYVLEYEFKNVITEYDEDGKLTTENGVSQELYWDTNGTGWPNRFVSVTANVHFAGDYKAKTPAYCYTGAQNSKARNCIAEKTSDGFTFKTTKSLDRYENMTFDIEFPAGTFKVPVYYNYSYVVAAGIAIFLAISTIGFAIKNYRKYAKEKSKYFKNLLVAPQYLPPKEISVAEAGQIYLENSKPTQTATLLELAVAHKIQLISEKTTSKILGKEKTIWKVKILNRNSLTSPQEKILKILNGGIMPKKDEIVEIKKRTATFTLAKLSREYFSSTRVLLKSKKLFESSVRDETGTIKSSKENSLSAFAMFLLVVGALSFSTAIISESTIFSYGRIIGEYPLLITIWATVIITVIIVSSINSKARKYTFRTLKGLDMSNYLEGLKLYIEMAEKERLEFNQSTKNAPKNEKGTVELYEKLLPYACMFGLEDSWLKEIQKYYENLNYSPDWYNGTDILTYSALNNLVSTTSTTIASNTAWHTSSSSSGGGGGGFSGGGGGGGGGGSW